MTFSWKDLSKAGAVAGSIGGMAIALIVWLAAAKATGGVITVDTLSSQWVSFAGNAAAIVSGGVLSIGLSLWRPANFDWEKTRAIRPPDADDVSLVSESEVEKRDSDVESDPEKKSDFDDVKVTGKPVDEATRAVVREGDTSNGLNYDELDKTFRFYGWLLLAYAIIITIVSLFKFQQVREALINLH